MVISCLNRRGIVMTNVEVVLRLYEEVFNNKDLSNLDAYMCDDYMQHNPTVKDGKEGFKEFLDFFFTMDPHMEILKIFENAEDEVAVFFKCTFRVNGVINKVVDIYRLSEGKLAEHWDVVEHDVKEFSEVNGRSLF